MSTLSPALADAFALLGDDLYGHLDEAEALASQVAEWSDDDTVRAHELIDDLVRLIRGLLIEHQLQPSNDCRICTSAWPCPVVTTIHAVVKDPQRQFVALVRRAMELS
ncbi:MAG: hypothetical protein LC799_05925 [Actinobacteria bacterium]|nr:hypothetical protein [Actinomycetota bacterium]